MITPRRTVSIGEAAKVTGASIKQIRYLEEKGLIAPPDRVICGEGSYRQYTDEDLDVIKSIKTFQDEGLTLRAAAQRAQKKGGRK